MAVLSARDARALVFALTTTLLVAPLAQEPAPPILALSFRVVAALLGGYTLWISVRPSRSVLPAARLGGSTESAFVALAFALGLLVPHSAPGIAGAPALAAALAIGVCGTQLLAFGVDTLRLGVGAVLFLLATTLGAGWLGGHLADATQVAAAAALLAASVVTGWIWLNATTGARAGGTGAPRQLGDAA